MHFDLNLTISIANILALFTIIYGVGKYHGMTQSKIQTIEALLVLHTLKFDKLDIVHDSVTRLVAIYDDNKRQN